MALLVVLAALFAAKDVLGGASQTTSIVYDRYLGAFAASRLLLVGIASLIAWKAPLTRQNLLLFGGIVGLSLDVFWWFVPPGVVFWSAAILANLAIGYGMAQLARYSAASHPNATFVRTVTWIAIPIGALIALAGLAYAGFGYIVGYLGDDVRWPSGRLVDDAAFLWLDRARWFGMLVASLAIETAAAATWRASNEHTRPRALLLVASFAPLVIATSIHALSRLPQGHDAAWAKDLDAIGNLLAAAGLTYGALTRRLVDVEFIISATIAAGSAVAAIVVLGFLADHYVVPFLAKAAVDSLPFLERYGEAIHRGTEAAFAFPLYVTMRKVHETSEHFVRGVFFHHREECLEALRKFAEQAMALGTAELPDALINAAVEHAQATGAAVYIRDGLSYRLVAGTRLDERARIAADDPLIPPLRRVKMVPDGTIALPMPGASTLSGFLLCGPKRTGTLYAPDEVAALGLATREAGIILSGLAHPTEVSRQPVPSRKRRRTRGRR